MENSIKIMKDGTKHFTGEFKNLFDSCDPIILKVTPKDSYVESAESYKSGHVLGEYKLKHLTIGKSYEVLRIDGGGNIYITADDGRERPHSFKGFDIVRVERCNCQ